MHKVILLTVDLQEFFKNYLQIDLNWVKIYAK